MASPISSDAQEVIDRMIGAVDLDNWDVDEYNLLGSIMVRAGVAWRCISHECRGINHLSCTRCDNCNSRRPKEREVPTPETMVGVSLEHEKRKRRKLRNEEQKVEETITNTEESVNELDH